jgi:hypothetical protein
MLTEKEIELEARLVAFENIVVHMAAFSLGLVPDEVIKIAHAQIRQHLRGVTTRLDRPIPEGSRCRPDL